VPARAPTRENEEQPAFQSVEINKEIIASVTVCIWKPSAVDSIKFFLWSEVRRMCLQCMDGDDRRLRGWPGIYVYI